MLIPVITSTKYYIYHGYYELTFEANEWEGWVCLNTFMSKTCGVLVYGL